MTDSIGLYNFSQQGQTFERPYSQLMNAKIDDETKRIVDEQYKRVKDLLHEKREQLNELVERLKTQETVVYKDLVEILGPRPGGIRPEYEKYVMATANQLSTEHEIMADPLATATETKDVDGEGDSSDNNSGPPSGGIPSVSETETEQDVTGAPLAAAVDGEKAKKDR